MGQIFSLAHASIADGRRPIDGVWLFTEHVGRLTEGGSHVVRQIGTRLLEKGPNLVFVLSNRGETHDRDKLLTERPEGGRLRQFSHSDIPKDRTAIDGTPNRAIVMPRHSQKIADDSGMA